MRHFVEADQQFWRHQIASFIHSTIFYALFKPSPQACQVKVLRILQCFCDFLPRNLGIRLLHAIDSVEKVRLSELLCTTSSRLRCDSNSSQTENL